MIEEWTVESEAPQKKGGLPAWFWWTCGTGCLLAVLMAVAIGIFALMAGRKMKDPEYLKSKLTGVLPCDTWPADYEPMWGGGMFGAGAYTIQWPDPLHVAIVTTVPGRADLRNSLDADAFQNELTNKDLEAGQLELQGRTVDTLRFKDLGGMFHLRTDISGEKSPYATLELVAEHEEDAARLEEAAVKFLEPFDLWRGED